MKISNSVIGYDSISKGNGGVFDNKIVLFGGKNDFYRTNLVIIYSPGNHILYLHFPLF